MIIISYLFFFLEAAYGSPDMIASLFKQLLDEVGSDETRGTCHKDNGYAIFQLFLAHTILKLLFRIRHYCQILLFPENISVYAIVPEESWLILALASVYIGIATPPSAYAFLHAPANAIYCAHAQDGFQALTYGRAPRKLNWVIRCIRNECYSRFPITRAL